MRILFAAGGTAGHINPAIALAQYLSSESNDTECLFATVPGGMEETLVKQAGFPTTEIEIQGLKRSFSLENLRRLAAVPRAIRRAKEILSDFKPDVVFATGGYLSYPIVRAARKMKIPAFLHESNAVAGFSIKLLSKRATAILLNYPSAAGTLSRKCVTFHVGNPLRSDFHAESRAGARRKLGISDNTFLILSFGGSLGASYLNEVCVACGAEITHSIPNAKWFHVTGKGKYAEVCEGIKNIPHTLKLFPYLDEMALYMAAADVVISRAGAVTLTELSALGKAAVLIPYPKAAANHQVRNASVYEKAGAAIVAEEETINKEWLLSTLFALWKHPSKRKKYEGKIKSIFVPDSCKKILKIIENLI